MEVFRDKRPVGPLDALNKFFEKVRAAGVPTTPVDHLGAEGDRSSQEARQLTGSIKLIPR